MPAHDLCLAQGGNAYLRSCTLVSQADGLVQQLGHLLIVGVVLSTSAATG